MSKNTNLSFLTDYITADITNGRIGINNASPTVAFDVTGATKITGVLTLTSTISNGTYAYTLPSATGTLALTSALSGYLPLTGGTLTGALGGTSATFSGLVTGVSYFNAQSNSGFRLRNLTDTATVGGFTRRGLWEGNANYDPAIWAETGYGLYLYTNGSTTPVLTLASTGAATFSSNATTNSNARYSVLISDTSSVASGNGGGIIFRGVYTGTTLVDAAGINTYKLNATDGDYAYGLNFTTRANGGNLTTGMVITPTGNVGIGTSSPSSLASTTNLIVRGTSAGSTALIQSLSLDGGCSIGLYSGASASDDGAILYQKNLRFGSVTDVGLGGFAERMRITSGGNVGIGTSSPSSLLHIKGSGNYDGQVIIGNGTTTGGGVLSIHQNGVSSGFFSTRGGALGNSNRDLTFYTSPGLGIYTYTNEGTAGPYIVSGGTSWTSSSDERLKDIKNIIPNAIESILKLRAVVHTWKYDNENKEHLGLLAQDLQKVYPQVVVEDDDEIKTLGVNYTELIPVLVKAIQELSAEITILKQK